MGQHQPGSAPFDLCDLEAPETPEMPSAHLRNGEKQEGLPHGVTKRFRNVFANIYQCLLRAAQSSGEMLLDREPTLAEAHAERAAGFREHASADCTAEQAWG